MQTVWNYILLVLWNSCETVIVLLPFFLLAGMLQFISTLLRQAVLLLTGQNLWTFLAIPGTAVHELSHALFCVIFRHKVTSMKLFSPDGKTLGFVNHSWNPRSFYQRSGNFFIGLAPVIIGTLVIWLLTLLLLPDMTAGLRWENFSSLNQVLAASWGLTCGMLKNFTDPAILTRWQSWLHFILLLLIGSHITLSPSDFKGVAAGALMLAGMIIVIALFTSPYLSMASGLIRCCGNFMAVSFSLMLFTGILLGIFILLCLPLIWLKHRKSPHK